MAETAGRQGQTSNVHPSCKGCWFTFPLLRVGQHRRYFGADEDHERASCAASALEGCCRAASCCKNSSHTKGERGQVLIAVKGILTYLTLLRAHSHAKPWNSLQKTVFHVGHLSYQPTLMSPVLSSNPPGRDLTFQPLIFILWALIPPLFLVQRPSGRGNSVTGRKGFMIDLPCKLPPVGQDVTRLYRGKWLFC